MINLEEIFAIEQDPNVIFTALMSALCETLSCDRCFLYLRNPRTSKGAITHCYSRSPEFADLTGLTFIEEGEIAANDPLMALAFRTPEAVFVDDIETASEAVVNVVYEQEAFGHRALIHAPIYHQGQLYGILEPCVFKHPREWTSYDRSIIYFAQQRSGSVAFKYFQQYQIN
jgi:GAF domain-containing protein